MIKTIVIFSNPFGYGPTGHAISVAQAFLKKLKEVKVLFAGGSMCHEILPTSITSVFVDERSQESIEGLLAKIDKPFVIGSQNRFCIKAARKLGIPCAFIDPLAWFWREIPDEHLLANEIFWINYPGIENKLLKSRSNIHLIRGIASTTPKILKRDDKLLIHLGGAKYPLVSDLPKNYLRLTARCLNKIAQVNSYRRILLVSSADVVNYFKSLPIENGVEYVTFKHDQFILEVATARHLMSVAGMSSTLEAFSSMTPISFLLPLNLSQIGLTNILKPLGACPQMLSWESYLAVEDNLTSLSERDGIAKINKYALDVLETPALLERLMEDMLEMANRPAPIDGQSHIVKMIGLGGEDDLVDILTRRWGLQ